MFILTPLKRLIGFCFMCLSVCLHLHMGTISVHLEPAEVKREHRILYRLELQRVVNSHTANQIWVLWKSERSS